MQLERLLLWFVVGVVVGPMLLDLLLGVLVVAFLFVVWCLER